LPAARHLCHAAKPVTFIRFFASLGDYSPAQGVVPLPVSPDHHDLLQAFAVLPCMPGLWSFTCVKCPMPPVRFMPFRGFPWFAAPTLPGFVPPCPFSELRGLAPLTSPLCGVGRPYTAWFPLLGFALRSFLVAPFPFGFPKAPFLPLRHPAEYCASATCRPCCHSTSPSVLPPHLRVFRNRNCD
jgi:hypothetical protein